MKNTELKFNFTKREKEVMHYMALGYNNENIAAKLGISRHTVKHYVCRILKKTHTSSRTYAVYILTKLNYI